MSAPTRPARRVTWTALPLLVMARVIMAADTAPRHQDLLAPAVQTIRLSFR